MTALKQYQRLDSTGLWRETPEAQRRDVLLSFGKATIIISDKTETALSHWSLAAIARQNPGMRPAVFQPGIDSGETLEIEDPLMIDAIETVRKTVAKHRPKQGRLRLVTFGVTLAVILALGFFWLPGALVRHAVSVLPDSTRLDIGQKLVGHLTRLTGKTCQSPLGLHALATLQSRVLGGAVNGSYIVPDNTHDALYLPGKLLVLRKTLVEDHEMPDVAAGYMLSATLTGVSDDPMLLLLQDAGMSAAFGLLTTGGLEEEVLSDYAETLMKRAPKQPQVAELHEVFKAAKVAMSPYAYALDVTGETTSDLIEADPFLGQAAPTLISDDDWVSLQSICEN